MAAKTKADTRAKKAAPAATRGKKTGTRGTKATGAPKGTHGTTRATKAKPDLDALREQATAAKERLDHAERDARAHEEAARSLRSEAKTAFRNAVAPYRDACRQAGVPCEFTAGRATNVSERVSFEVVKVAKGLKVTVKGRPETEEIIPAAKLNVSLGKSAYDYTDKHLGPREEIGNKGGSLANRLRATLKGGAK